MLPFSGCKLGEGDAPCPDIRRRVAVACWCTFDEHFIALCAVVAQVNHCSISSDQLVSNPWWIEVVVTCPHLVGVLGFCVEPQVCMVLVVRHSFI